MRSHGSACRIAAIVAFALLCLAAWPAAADVKLPAVIGDNMVLQRGVEVPIWGWAAAGEKVTVTLGDQSAEAAAGADGKWMVRLKPLQAGPGAPRLEMTVKAGNTVTLKNILVGEVWVCSGQSNMEMNVGGCYNAKEEIAAADYPKIRLLTIQKSVAPQPQADAPGSSGWLECSPKTVGGFSAVAYFFGRDLFKSLDVPIGLIHTSWGGTPAESWTSGPALESLGDFKDRLENYQRSTANFPEAKKKYEEELAKWEKALADAKAKAQGQAKDWAKPSTSTAGWKTMRLPQQWEQAGLNIDGAVWFRKDVQVYDAWAGKDLTLSLGPIDDDDVTYFNGTEVGQTQGWTTPRRYTVPGRLVQAGKNVIAVRVLDNQGGGGIYGQADDMTLSPPGADARPISLAGDWLYKVEYALPPRPPAPMGMGNPWAPSGLYNAMIHPLIPYAFRGAIWYQGESNADRAYQYRRLFAAMINDWRKNWGQGDFPFGFVQLANFMGPPQEPGPSTWAELREAQLMTLKLPNTGQAVIIDIGDAKDIHPKNKQDVGKRLALWARAMVHGEKIEYSGPAYKSMAIEDGKIRLRFDHVGGGLVAKDGPLKQFAVAGEDKNFVWAEAKIEPAKAAGEAADTVLVWSDKVPKPLAVRYAWANNPEGCNLYNKAGLPASPFRTDDWPGVTANAK